MDRLAMQKLFRTLISIICFLLSSFVFGQELPFTHYTQDNEVVALPSADVRTIYQDRASYIWFVVYSSGLLRYNGHKTDIYTKEDGLPDLTVLQILEDHLGRLWVATNLGLAVSEKPLKEYTGNQRIGFSNKIGATQLIKTSIVANRMAVDAQGRLWIGTREDGILRYHFNGLDSVSADTIGTRIYGEEKNKDIRSITLRRDGSVWVGIGGGNLLVFTAASAAYDVLAEKDGAPRFETDALFENRSGKLWGGCRNGLLWSLVEEAGQRRVEVFSEDLKSRITCITGTQDGKLWVASDGSGIMSITDGNFQVPQSSSPLRRVIFTQRNGLLGDNVAYTIEDREGNIWLAQLGGVSKLRSNYAAFTNFPPTSRLGEKSALLSPSLNAVLPPAEGRPSSGIWVGTSGAGAALIEAEGKIELIQTDRGLRENWVNGLVRDGKGRIWMGTADGINCLSFDSQNPPPPSPEIHSISVLNRKGIIAAYEHHTIYACQKLAFPAADDKIKSVESLWFPGYQHLYCFSENEWFIFKTASGLPATLFHTVAFDEAGRLLVGTRDRGLYRSRFPLTRTRLRQLQAEDVGFPIEKGGGKFGREISTSIFEPVWNQSTGAPSNQIENLLWRDGILWVGTTEGLSVLESEPPRMTTHLTVAQGLKASNVTSMAFSPVSGTLWVGTNGGLAEIDPQTRKVIRTVTKQDGLVDNEVWFYGSVVMAADGAVYFGTAKGLAIYRPQLDKPSSVLPILRLERADFTEDHSGDNEIAFEYAALSFANEKLVRYKTRLVGYDKAWTEEKSEFKIRYTNLPAFLFSKKYTFEVLASNDAGFWTEMPLLHSFTVQPPWWFRWWWLALNAVLWLAIVYGFSRYRLRRLEMRSKVLERTVQERTEEIRQQAEELETLDGIVKVINREVALESVLRSLLEQGLKLFPQAEKASVLLFDPQIGRFKFAVAAGYDPHTLKDVFFTPEELVSRYSQGSEEVGSGVYIVRDLQNRYVEKKLNLAAMPRSVLAMTAAWESKPEAYLIFDNLTNAEAFDHSDAHKLGRFREHAISAIAKAKMLQELQEKNAEIIKTQNQLIMQEKLASLGALTAGIAHEIRNPLNFVNNFAELSTDLTQSLQEDLTQQEDRLDPKVRANMEELVQDLQQNLAKINQHGKRIDTIVGGMLLHSQGKTGERVPTEINALLDEYVHLADHGLRAQDSSYSVAIKTDYDRSIGEIEVVPLDLSRVFLNMVKNACYAANEKKKTAPPPFIPTVSVCTRNLNGNVEIRIRDNGSGIPKNIVDRIFNPFFTTKPTGQGTGLGLSLSYDVVVKEHKGEIKVETEEGQYAEFIITLPMSKK